MESQKPRFTSIQQIKDAKDAQIKLIEDLREKQWNDLSTGTDEIQVINTQNVEKVKQGLVDLDYELTDAYGLGPNGYWNKDSKAYGARKPMIEDLTTGRMAKSTGQQLPTNFDLDDTVMKNKSPQRTKPTFDSRPDDYAVYNIPKGYGTRPDDYAGHKLSPSKVASEVVKPANSGNRPDDYAGMGYSKPDIQAVEVKPEDKEKPITPTQSLLDDMFNAGGKGKPEDGENGDKDRVEYLKEQLTD